ncbi:hypothetical protein [Agromyces arachidis]|uniref:hypothetical protein n=1 Tax=Agromyces arachidis TaxID=766966 RepID=UPI004056B428
MPEDIRPHDPVEGEYTDSELPVDAEAPEGRESAANDGDWNGTGEGDVVVEEVDVVIVEEDEGEYTDTDYDGDGIPDRR